MNRIISGHLFVKFDYFLAMFVESGYFSSILVELGCDWAIIC